MENIGWFWNPSEMCGMQCQVHLDSLYVMIKMAREEYRATKYYTYIMYLSDMSKYKKLNAIGECDCNSLA